MYSCGPGDFSPGYVFLIPQSSDTCDEVFMTEDHTSELEISASFSLGTERFNSHW